MKPYTSTEILQAGADDTRRTHAHLYLELERLHAALGWHWHRVNIDPDVPLLDGEERLPSHPAGPAFGGNTLAIPTRTVNLARLTPAGRELYRIGCRTALDERQQLIAQILNTRRLLDAAATARTSREQRALAEATARAITTAYHRARERQKAPITADSWPVRMPGENTWIIPPTATRKATP